MERQTDTERDITLEEQDKDQEHRGQKGDMPDQSKERQSGTEQEGTEQEGTEQEEDLERAGSSPMGNKQAR